MISVGIVKKNVDIFITFRSYYWNVEIIKLLEYLVLGTLSVLEKSVDFYSGFSKFASRILRKEKNISHLIQVFLLLTLSG